MSRSPRDPTEVKQRKYNQNPWTPLFDSGVYISESEDGLIESLSEGFLHKLILIMPPSRPVTSSHRGRKKLIRPSSASANLHCYSISVLDNGQRPATAATSGLLSDKPQRPTTQAGGSRKQWEPPKEDTSFIEAAKQPRRLTLGAVDGILELESIKRPGNIQGSVSQQLKNKIEEQINIETLEQLKQAFAEADANQSGQLDLEEFKALLKQRLYIKGNKENQIDSLFMKIDWSSEGVISWDEFCTYMQLEYAEKEDSYLRSKEVSFHLPAKIQNPQHKNPILKITDTQDGTFIACSQDGMVTFWGANVELKETKYVVNTEAKNKQKTKWITDFVIMAQWKKVLVGTGDREIQFFDASSYKPYCQISSLETVPLKLDYCATGSDECLILYGDSDGCINILVINSVGECLRTWNKLPSKEGFIAEISLSDAISKSKIQFIRWKVHRDWVQQLKYYHEIGQVISCSNHQETALVIGCTSGSTRVDQGGNSNAEKAKKTNARVRLDADQKVFYVYKGVKCFDFSKDKNIIVTGGMDRIVRLWNPYVSDKPTAMLRGHNAPIFYLFIANDENRVFSLSTDKCIKVWDILDHNCLLTVRPKGHKIRGDLQACHYSSAAKSIAIATDQMAILNLKLKNRRLVSKFYVYLS